ncbi:MAG: hypothetical protein V4545_06805 [Pseudomonadota bacterium]
MIISPDAITWLLIGKTIDDKTILKLAKLRNVEISDSLRKNIANSFSNKHIQSRTTINGIKDFFKKLIPHSSFHMEIDQLDLYSQVRISNTKESLIYIESGYVQFFEATKTEDSFISSEISKIFTTLYDMVAQKDGGISTNDIENFLLKDDLLSQLDLDNDLYIDLGVNEVIHNKFSLNLLLYLCACLDVNNGRNEYSNFQLIFVKLLSDIDKLKSPFYYYVMSIKEIFVKHGRQLSTEKLCEKLDIEPKSFSRYMNGTRKVHIKHIGSIIERGDILYFCIAFWVNLLVKLCKTDEIRLLFIESLKRYPQYFDIALLNFHKFKPNVI